MPSFIRSFLVIVVSLLSGCFSIDQSEPLLPAYLPQQAGLWGVWYDDVPGDKAKYQYTLVMTNTVLYRNGIPDSFLGDAKQLSKGRVSFKLHRIGRRDFERLLTLKKGKDGGLRLTIEQSIGANTSITTGIMRRVRAPKFEKVCIRRKLTDYEMLGRWRVVNGKKEWIFLPTAVKIPGIADDLPNPNYLYDDKGQGMLTISLKNANAPAPKELKLISIGMDFAVLRFKETFKGKNYKEIVLSRPNNLCSTSYREWLAAVARTTKNNSQTTRP